MEPRGFIYNGWFAGKNEKGEWSFNFDSHPHIHQGPVPGERGLLLAELSMLCCIYQEEPREWMKLIEPEVS